MKTVNGKFVDHIMTPKVLPKDCYRYHCDAVSELRPSADDNIVMLSSGAVFKDGYDAGTNDGLRDGALSARVDMRQNHVVYCLLSEWIEAGNDTP